MNVKRSAAWAIVAVLALLRLRRTAVLAATGPADLVWRPVAGAPNWVVHRCPVHAAASVAGLEIAALLASAGPRRAMPIINWRHYALAVLSRSAWRPCSAGCG